MAKSLLLTESDIKDMVANGLINLLRDNQFTLDKKEKVQLKKNDPSAILNAPTEFKKYLADAVSIRTKRLPVGPSTKADYNTCIKNCAQNYTIAPDKCLKIGNEYLKKDPRYMTILKKIAVDMYKVLDANSEQ